jgi:hypothetical protein
VLRSSLGTGHGSGYGLAHPAAAVARQRLARAEHRRSGEKAAGELARLTARTGAANLVSSGHGYEGRASANAKRGAKRCGGYRNRTASPETGVAQPPRARLRRLN